MNIGARIKEAREALEMTQAELGLACGWDDAQTRVSHYERNKREPTVGDFEKLAKALQVDPAFLAFGKTRLEPDESRLLMAYRGAEPVERRFLLRSALAAKGTVPHKKRRIQ